MVKLSNKFKKELKSRLGKGEKILLIKRQTTWMYRLPLCIFLVFVVIMVIANLFGNFFSRSLSHMSVQIYFIALFIVPIILIIWFIIARVKASKFCLVLTSRKMIVYDSIMPLEIDYEKLESSEVEQSFIGKLLKYGRITIHNKISDSSRVLVDFSPQTRRTLDKIPTPNLVNAAISKMIALKGKKKTRMVEKNK